jgi:hypothetical protein
MIINGWEKLNEKPIYHPLHPNDIYGMVVVDFFELGRGRYKGKVQTTLTDDVLHFELKRNFLINDGTGYILETEYTGESKYTGSNLFPIEDVTLDKIHRLINENAAIAFDMYEDKQI